MRNRIALSSRAFDKFNGNGVPELLNAQKFLFVVNALGLPSVAVPTHVEQGLPCGVQVVAPMGEDYLALDMAEIVEQELGTIIGQLWDRN